MDSPLRLNLYPGVFIAACLLANGAAVFAQPRTPTITRPSGFAISPPLSSIEDFGTEPGTFLGPSALKNPGRGTAKNPADVDHVAQHGPGPHSRALRGAQFPGVGANGFAPSDDNIAVGPNHIVQMVNARYQVFDKSGNSVAGPFSLGSLWNALGSPCNGNGGDGVAQYDKAADRWFLSQLGIASGNYTECIAVSQTNNPAGAYFLYSYSFGNNLNDYPKFGVWPTATNSAYLGTYNLFANAQSGVGADLCAYDRAAMLAGALSPAQVCFTISNDFSYLPSDVDGPTPPANGTPGYFMTLETTSSLRTYQLAPNFANPAASTLTQAPDIGVAGFAEACGGGTCIPQAATTQTLDSLGDRPMYRLPYRVFSDHAALLMNHSVSAGSGIAAPRWYELRQTPVSTSGNFSLFQQGTFAPDSTYRWMGSIGMDQSGNIAMGYSASSGSLHPAIRHTGRIPTDPAGTMETEASIVEGAGSQTAGLSRWGDYTAMRIDPSDDCTFWYTNQYEASNGTFNWSTAIGSFKFPGCGVTTSDFSISANPTSAAVFQGGSTSSTITVTSMNGYSNLVNLSNDTCPANATCSFTAASVTPPANSSATSTFSVATTANTPPGTYAITITGSDGTLTHTTTFTVTVNAPTPDFGISVSPTSLTVPRGSSGGATVALTSSGSTSITLSQSGAPPRTSVSFSPNPVAAPGSSSMSIQVNRKAPRGTFTITITGTNGPDTHSTQLTLTIN